MKKKDQAKKRRKRLERALGAGGCDRCKHLSPFLSRTGTKMNTYRGNCPSCRRPLLLELDKFDSPEILVQFIRCVASDRESCLHALTIKVDGEVVREDPPCACGKTRVELDNNLHVRKGEDYYEAARREMVAKLEGKFGGLLEYAGGQPGGEAPPAG